MVLLAQNIVVAVLKKLRGTAIIINKYIHLFVTVLFHNRLTLFFLAMQQTAKSYYSGSDSTFGLITCHYTHVVIVLVRENDVSN